MTPKERKSWLFKKSRPNVRPFVLMDGEKYSKDTGILWAAYQAGSFKISAGMTQEQFAEELKTTVENYSAIWIIDDDNALYSSGRGPVALVVSKVVDLIVEPEFMFFKWATCRNVLRATVAFLNMAKSSTKTGILLVRADAKKRKMADHMKKYELLFFMGKSKESEYLYSIRGFGSANGT